MMLHYKYKFDYLSPKEGVDVKDIKEEVAFSSFLVGLFTL